MTDPTQNLIAAERALFALCGIEPRSRRLRLADPDLKVRVLEAGEGEPLVLIHGSGMSAPTWAPLIARLERRRVLAVDLPGFGLSDAFDYRGRTLRAHAVAQLTSLLDALELDEAELAGNSLGAMWALSLAQAAPERVTRATVYGVPAVALPGVKANAFFKLASTPGLGRLMLHVPAPRDVRKATTDVIGTGGLPDEFFAVLGATMRMPAWRLAMWSHLNLAFASGRQRPENLIGDDELRAMQTPVRFVMGNEDVYGSPALAERAAALMPDATVEVVAGAGHAPFLDGAYAYS
jgi:pimeloyl-ACP methyl ester carboxylesterase